MFEVTRNTKKKINLWSIDLESSIIPYIFHHGQHETSFDNILERDIIFCNSLEFKSRVFDWQNFSQLFATQYLWQIKNQSEFVAIYALEVFFWLKCLSIGGKDYVFRKNRSLFFTGKLIN